MIKHFLNSYDQTEIIEYIDWSVIFTLIILVVSLPIRAITSTRDICLGFASFLWFVRSILTKNWHPIQTPLDRAWAIYGVCALISLLTAVDFIHSLDQFRGEYIKNFLLFLLVIQFVTTKKRAKVVLMGVLAGNVLMVSYGILEFIINEGSLISRVTAPAQSGWGSLQGRGGAYSAYLITVFPFLVWLVFYRKKMWVQLMAIVLVGANLFSLYITFQRGALVALFALILAVIIITPLKGYFKLVGFFFWLVAAITLAWFVPRGLSSDFKNMTTFNKAVENPEQFINVRFEIWHYSIGYLIKNPFKGCGFGRASLNKKYPYYKTRGRGFWHAHNMFLNIGLELGVQGLVAFCYLLASVFWIGLEGYRKSKPDTLSHFLGGSLMLMVIAVTFRNMFDDFFVDDTALLFWFLCGLSVAVIQREIFLPQKRCSMGEQMR